MTLPANEVRALVLEFFEGDENKTWRWFGTKNPAFGVSPNDMIALGRYEQLFEWVKAQLAENETPKPTRTRTKEEELQAISPDKVVLDRVLHYNAERLRPYLFQMMGERQIVLLVPNHRNQLVQTSIELHFDDARGPSDPGEFPPYFVAYKIGATVWKVAPSLTVPGMIHTYLTLVDVPEPAPWESKA